MEKSITRLKFFLKTKSSRLLITLLAGFALRIFNEIIIRSFSEGEFFPVSGLTRMSFVQIAALSPGYRQNVSADLWSFLKLNTIVFIPGETTVAISTHV